MFARPSHRALCCSVTFQVHVHVPTEGEGGRVSFVCYALFLDLPPRALCCLSNLSGFWVHVYVPTGGPWCVKKIVLCSVSRPPGRAKCLTKRGWDKVCLVCSVSIDPLEGLYVAQ